MTHGLVQESMLLAVFAISGGHLLLIHAGLPAARRHLWLGMACFAATGALASRALAGGFGATATTPTEGAFAATFALGWAVFATWYATMNDGIPWRTGRRAAVAATAMLGVSSLICWISAERLAPMTPAAAGTARLLEIAGLVVASTAAVVASVREWNRGVGLPRISRAAVSALLVAVTWLAIAREGSCAELALPVLYGFALVVLLKMFALARTLIETERLAQSQRQELAHASRQSVVGELTAAIAHEINQPLGAILSNADAGEVLLERGDPPLAELRRIITDIRRDGLRASDVIRNIRTLVRQRHLDMRPIDANALVAEVVALMDVDARRRRISLVAVTCPQPLTLRGDRALLEQVLINLLSNAMDATESLGPPPASAYFQPPIVLDVDTTAYGGIQFRVVDSGVGIPMHRIDHIFDSFHTSKPHGMGLGLAISRSIVQAHGGRITAENVPGGGARFVVTLPPGEEASATTSDTETM